MVMHPILLLQAICTLTLVNLASFAYASDGGLIEAASHQSKRRVWSGRQFRDIQYPSERELSELPLRELLQLRPTKIEGAEQAHFAHLFAKHPSITRLDPSDRDNFIKGWVKLWITQREGPHSKKLPNAIKAHLDRDKSVDAQLFNDILGQYRKAKDSIAQQKHREKNKGIDDPVKLAKWRAYEANRRKSYPPNARLCRRQQSADRFRSLLTSHEIPVDLPAEDIEILSRDFREAIGGAQRTSLALRHFLLLRPEVETDRIRIDRVLVDRKLYNARLSWEAVNEKVKLRKTRKKKHQTADDQTTLPNEHVLIAASSWWLP